MEEELEELGYTVYGISPTPPDVHEEYAAENDLNMELLSDPNGEVGIEHGFIDEEEEMIYRGMIVVQPESGEMAVEVDYLAGDNQEEVLELLEQMNP
ncbi:hypothetical protein C6I21_15520 [Alkalicoccus urumqiensis]|uniref:Alkyl hydroperoxide reductase subunit C/ Thiol specific antioxidant domain-containing protein n=1 Tax=Alkalicoccus urumqiensis TaxID=1548213 RepID=A0A2P6MDB3_ALKUR|nr:hypothetical protein C6I21_15520 [Alkalicoccus urumqiensis]